MNTTTNTRSARRGTPVLIALAIAVGAVGIYVGMRWHTTFEHWLVPSANTANKSPAPQTTPTTEKKQLWTCGMHPQVIQDHPGDCPICHMKLTPLVNSGDDGAPTSPAPGASATVTIDPVVVQNMGVRMAQVTEGPLRQTVRVAANITEAEWAHRDISLRVSGWIQTLYANTDGMQVKKGDPLFDLYSPDLRLAIEELISAKKAAAAPDSGSGHTMHETSTALVAAAESRLLALDLTAEQVREFGAMEHAPSVVKFVAPTDGHITDKEGVYAGSSVMAGQRLFRLAEWNTLWVEGRVPENEIGRVRVGQKASASVPAYPGRTFEGEVAFIHPHLDDATRTALVRIVIPNHDYALHQGMYATADIDVGGGEQALLVPREAVIDSGESQMVFVSAGNGRFEPRRVTIGAGAGNGLVQVLGGLKAGDEVVASGQFLLDSESRLREAIRKFMKQEQAPAPPTQTPHASEPITPEQQGALDALVKAYLDVSAALAAEPAPSDPVDTAALETAAKAFKDGAKGSSLESAAGELAQATGRMHGQQLGEQRKAFKGLSTALVGMVDAHTPSKSVGGPVRVMYCPMVKNAWMQREEDVANPFDPEMHSCGSLLRTLTPMHGAKP